MDGLIGQVMMFGGSFAPRNWAFCDGQLLSISSYPALFSILGTMYGGDGRTSFALPDLRSRIPIHAGAGPGLSPRQQGSKGGQETVTLTKAQLPSHNHLVGCTDAPGNVPGATGHIWAAEEHGATDVWQSSAPDKTMNPAMIQSDGGGQAHDNMEPYLPLRYIICLNGVFPSRN